MSDDTFDMDAAVIKRLRRALLVAEHATEHAPEEHVQDANDIITEALWPSDDTEKLAGLIEAYRVNYVKDDYTRGALAPETTT